MSEHLPAATEPPDPSERDPLDPGLPYRPNVGICLFNAAGLVFAGRALPNPFGWPDPEVMRPGEDWIVPQGGIDPGEAIVAAARRELWEETGVVSADFLGVTDDWWPYDFPARGSRVHKLHPFRGQTQRFAAFRFTGAEAEIAIGAEHTDEPPEFLEWAWLPLPRLAEIGPIQRRANYRRAAAAFATFCA